MNTISLCPGPSALHADAMGAGSPCNDNKIVIHSDSKDKVTPNFDYLLGYLRKDYLVGSKVRAPCCQVQNKGLTMCVNLSCQRHAFWYKLALLTSLFQRYRFITFFLGSPC